MVGHLTTSSTTTNSLAVAVRHNGLPRFGIRQYAIVAWTPFNAMQHA